MYIYLITNQVNDKKYVGQTTQEPLKRWNAHKSMNKPDKILYKAFTKYGIENFKFEVIDECSSQDELIKAEIEWISHYNTFLGEGYNMTSGGEGIGGWNHTEEAKQKIGKASKGNTHRIGCKISDEHKEILRQTHLGKKLSDEHKQKISDTHLGKPKNYDVWNKGIPMTDEIKDKVSLACSKNKVSQYTKDNIFIKTYDTVREASIECNIILSGIYKNCSGFQKTAGGFVWRYV